MVNAHPGTLLAPLSRMNFGTRVGVGSPLQVTGLQAWYNFTDAAYLTLAGTAITQALDLSGNGNHSDVQGTSTLRPTFTEDQLNGLSVAAFDGGDYLALPSALYAIPNGNFTIFSVSKQTVNTPGQRIMASGIGGSSRLNLSYSTNLGVFYNNASFDSVVTTITATNWNSLTAFKNGTTQSISANGDTATTDAAGTDVSGINQFVIGSAPSGGGDFLNGAIAEILIYNRKLSASEILQVEIYIANKYGIYHPSATWINNYTADQQAIIHALKLNKDDAFTNNAANKLRYWIDLTDEDTLTLDGSNKISSVAQLSGTTLGATTQGSGAAQPTFSGGTTVFNGTSTFLTLPDLSSYIDLTKDFTVLVVHKSTTLASGDNASWSTMLTLTKDTNNRFGWVWNLSRGFHWNYYNGSSYGFYTGPTTTDTNRHIYALTHNSSGNVTDGIQDKNDFTTSGASGSIGTPGFVIGYEAGGSRFYYNGSVEELMIFEGVLTDDQIDTLMDRFGPKHGVTVS